MHDQTIASPIITPFPRDTACPAVAADYDTTKRLLDLPSFHQIGDRVHVEAVIKGVVFREGTVNYEVELGSRGAEQVAVMRSFDVFKPTGTPFDSPPPWRVVDPLALRSDEQPVRAA